MDNPVSANRNHDTYRQFGYEVVPDQVSGYPGPLAGILSAMSAVSTPYILTVPCDTPNIAPDLWMKNATGRTVGPDALLQATAAALEIVEVKMGATRSDAP